MKLRTAPIHAVGIVLLGGLVLFVCLLAIRPRQQLLAELKTAIDETQHLEANLTSIKQQNLNLSRQIEDKRNALAEKYCLKTDATVPLIEKVTKLLSVHQLSLRNLRENAGENQIRSVDVNFGGDYGNIVRFLHDVRHMEQPARISILRLEPNADAENQFAITLQIEFFPPTQRPSALSRSLTAVPNQRAAKHG